MTELLDTSVAEEYRFIKEFGFSPSLGFNPYNELTFSDSSLIRLNPANYNIQLKKDEDGYYSTDSDIYVRTWVTNPKSLRRLDMLQVMCTRDSEFSVNVRLHNGTDDYYWDGAQWSVAGAGNWNTEAEINANIQTFDVLPDREFAVVLNLVTTNNEKTPSVFEVRVLMQVRIDYIEDIVYRSLIPLFQTGFRPLANWPIPAVLSDTTTIDLNDYQLDEGFDIVDIDAVFDFSDDPNLLYNIFSSYDENTKIITLSQTIPTGNVPFLLVRYVPLIAYTTNQDYAEDGSLEVAKLPAIVIHRIEIPLSSRYPLMSKEGVVDKGTGAAVEIDSPIRADIEFIIHVFANRGVDQMRMTSKMYEFFENNKFLTSVGLDEKYPIQIVKEFRDVGYANKADEHNSWTRFAIRDVRMAFSSTDTYGVQRVVFKFSEPANIIEDPIIGGSELKSIEREIDDEKQWEEIIYVEE
jgi:hypothetical protein